MVWLVRATCRTLLICQWVWLAADSNNSNSNPNDKDTHSVGKTSVTQCVQTRTDSYDSRGTRAFCFRVRDDARAHAPTHADWHAYRHCTKYNCIITCDCDNCWALHRKIYVPSQLHAHFVSMLTACWLLVCLFFCSTAYDKSVLNNVCGLALPGTYSWSQLILFYYLICCMPVLFHLHIAQKITRVLNLLYYFS